MADQLEETDVVLLREVFGAFDERSEGHVGSHKLAPMLRCVGLAPSRAQLREWKAFLDRACDKKLDVLTFFHLAAVAAASCPNPDDVLAAFAVLDPDGNGTLPAAELRHLLTSHGERLSHDEVEQFMAEAGAHSTSGDVRYRPFAAVLTDAESAALHLPTARTVSRRMRHSPTAVTTRPRVSPPPTSHGRGKRG